MRFRWHKRKDRERVVTSSFRSDRSLRERWDQLDADPSSVVAVCFVTRISGDLPAYGWTGRSNVSWGSIVDPKDIPPVMSLESRRVLASRCQRGEPTMDVASILEVRATRSRERKTWRVTRDDEDSHANMRNVRGLRDTVHRTNFAERSVRCTVLEQTATSRQHRWLVGSENASVVHNDSDKQHPQLRNETPRKQKYFLTGN